MIYSKEILGKAVSFEYRGIRCSGIIDLVSPQDMTIGLFSNILQGWDQHKIYKQYKHCYITSSVKEGHDIFPTYKLKLEHPIEQRYIPFL